MVRCLRYRWATIALAMIGATACKPKSTSETLAIENFAAGAEVTTDLCGSHPDEWKRLEKTLDRLPIEAKVSDARLKLELEKEAFYALTAVPEEVLKALLARNFKVEITADVGKACTAGGAIKGYAKERVAACVIDLAPERTNDTKASGITLMLAPDRTVIRSKTLRSISYFLVQNMARRANVPGVFSADRMAKLQIDLAKAYLQDLHVSKVFSLKSVDPLLGAGVGSHVAANLERDPKAFGLEGLKYTPGHLQLFLDYLTAESFDSAYCTFDNRIAPFDRELADRIANGGSPQQLSRLVNSRQVFAHFFPRAWHAYAEVDSYLRVLARELSGSRGPVLPIVLDATEEAKGFSLGIRIVSKQQRELEKAVEEKRQAVDQQRNAWDAERHLQDESWRRRNITGEDLNAMHNDYVNKFRDMTNTQELLRRQIEADNPKFNGQIRPDTPLAPTNYAGLEPSKWQAFKEGLGEGVDNVGGAVGKTAEGVVQAAYDVADGKGGELIQKKIDDIATKVEAQDTFWGASFEVAKETPILGTVVKTAQNTSATFGFDPQTGNYVNSTQAAEFAKAQGDVAAGAVLDVVADGVGKVGGAVIDPAANTFGRTSVSAVQSLPEALASSTSKSTAALASSPVVTALSKGAGYAEHFASTKTGELVLDFAKEFPQGLAGEVATKSIDAAKPEDPAPYTPPVTAPIATVPTQPESTVDWGGGGDFGPVEGSESDL